VTDRATDVLVVGGSVAGLTAALALERRGIDVTLVDADPATATPGTGADDPPRRATPQAGHSHTFLARCRSLLLVEAPDALDALLAAGGHEIVLAEQRPATVPAHTPHPDTAQLVALATRRGTFEAALREVAGRRPGIRRLSPRRAVALLVGDRQVGGAVFDDGSRVAARLVVDATGRRTPMPGWLADHDIVVDEQSEECGIAYLTRFYRRPHGAPDLPLDRGFAAGGSFDRYSCLVFPGDGATFSVTFGVLPEDRTLRSLLREPDAFDAAARSIPSLAPWLDAEPISEVRVMAGLVNRLRNPVVPGWTAVGDAAATTNPAHSRGCTLAAVHAVAVADAVAAHDDLGALAHACAAVVAVEQAPWVADSISQDRDRLARWRPTGQAPHPHPDDRCRLTNGEAFAAARHDAYVWRRFTRLQQLLEKPDDVLADPRVVARVRAVQASRVRTPGLDGPTHPELIDLLSRERVA
jgi:flavin-dependent dehydrogenase